MEEKTMMPINNQIEPDFLEHIKSTFKRWRDLNTQGVTIGARELSNFAFTLKGASMNSHLGFKYNFNPRGTDADGNPAITLKLYTKPEQMNPAAANRELNRANEQFPLFTSKHEGVAVAYEELEESKEALEELEASFKCLWDDVRGKETPCYLKEEITPLKIADYAINLACEAVQTAAMLMKYEMSLNPAAEREGE